MDFLKNILIKRKIITHFFNITSLSAPWVYWLLADKLNKQECIQVECVPSPAVTAGGSAWGVSAQGGCLPEGLCILAYTEADTPSPLNIMRQV